MSLPIVQYSPDVQVFFFSDEGIIDPVINGDLLAVYVDRAVNEPTGKWEVHLTAQHVGGKSYAARIKPMDYVEINMSEASPVVVNGTTYTMAKVMRGFVDNCQESLDGDGNWRVVVNGRDYGKLLLQFQVYYRAEIDPVLALLDIGKLEYNFGIGGFLTPATFVGEIDRQLLQPNIALLRKSRPVVPNLITSVTVPYDYGVNGLAIQPFTGSVWNLLTQYASRPFIEVFVTDEQQGPILFYRFPPYFDYDGNFIDDGSGVNSAPHYAHISAGDIISMSIGRSDNEVYTYYFTYPIFTYLDRANFKSAGVLSGINPRILLDQFDIYGFRPLEIATSLIPVSDISQQPGPGAIPLETLRMAEQLNNWLFSANRDNHLFMNGTITMRGAGGIQIGMYLNIADLNLQAYVTSARWEFDASQGKFTTTVGVSRVRPLK